MLFLSGTMDENVFSNVPYIMASLEDFSNYVLTYFREPTDALYGRRL